MIDRWRIVLTDEEGADLDLNIDLPDCVTQEIDEIIESVNKTTWGDHG